MKWPNESLRVQAYKLKKADPSLTDESIYDRFVKEKKIIAPVNSTPTPIITDTDHGADHNHPSAGNDSEQSLEPTFEDITEFMWKECLLQLVNDAYAKHELTPAIIDKMRDYLDKKKLIQQTYVERPKPAIGDAAVLID